VCPPGAEYVDLLDACAPPRVDRPPEPRRIVGITAFALPQHDPIYIHHVCRHIASVNYNTFRVGFERWRWDNDPAYLLQGPKYDTEENLSQIRRFLEVTARHEGIWVELVAVFTIKSIGHTDTPEMRREAVELAMQVVTEGDYKHVFFSYANEWRRSGAPQALDPFAEWEPFPLSDQYPAITKEEVLWGLQRLSQTGRLVTTDCHGEHVDGNPGRTWDPAYEKSFLPHVDMVAFHPRRNPNPTEFDLRLGVSRYVEREDKLAVLYNETTSFATDLELQRFPNLIGSFLIANKGRPPEEKRRQQIREYLARVKAAGDGARWYYHCIGCFMYQEEFEPIWIPAW